LQQQIEQALNLECISIPNNSDKICYITTQSSYGPYDEVVYARFGSEESSCEDHEIDKQNQEKYCLVRQHIYQNN
jgi:hypothetical protein